MPGEWLYFLLACCGSTNQLLVAKLVWHKPEMESICLQGKLCLTVATNTFQKVQLLLWTPMFSVYLLPQILTNPLSLSNQFASICKLVGIFHANYWRPEHSAIDQSSFQCSTAYLFETNLVLASKLQQPLANLSWNTNLSIATGWLQPHATSLGI